MKKTFVITVDGNVMITHGVFQTIEKAKEKCDTLAREYAEWQAKIDNKAYLQRADRTVIVIVDRGYKTSTKTFVVMEVNLV